MPEGPSIVILRDACQQFVGKKVLRADGNSKLIDVPRMTGKRVTAILSWGKHFLIRFPRFSLRVHFMLFGSYRINERRESAPRVSLEFANGELNLYACSVKFIEERLDDVYDWSSDVLSPQWDPVAARRKLRAHPDMLVCDALLDQSIFSGVGNIIKNETLFRIRLHPASRVGALPPTKLTELIREARNYSFDFLEWKKAFVLRKHWLVHNKGTCPRCDIPLQRAAMGKHRRRTFYCENCQVLFDQPGSAVRPSAGSKPGKRIAKKTARQPQRAL
jgi:endonuclease-8